MAAKLEWFNPGGSVKDRTALAMINDAESRGLLKEGSTIVEATSGNTGVGLAAIAARRGYRCVFTMPDKMSDEKFALLRAYGAEVIACPTAVAPEDPRSYYSVAARLAEDIPGAWRADQYHNPVNPAVHTATTGPEIWAQTAGKVTHFVAGAGTGGTVTGIGRYLKFMNPEIEVVVADPQGSVYSGGTGRAYMVEGVGEDFWPSNYDPAIVDRVIEVSDAASFAAARRVANTEGLLVGGSSGTAVVAAQEVARTAAPGALIVVLLADNGRSYLSRVYNDTWMEERGFDIGRHHHGMVGLKTAVEATRATLPVLVHTHPEETVAEALGIMLEYQVSQLPVLSAEPPVTLGEVIGTVTLTVLRQMLDAGNVTHDTPVLDVMSPALPAAGAGEPANVVPSRAERSGAVLVTSNGKVEGVLTPEDIYGLIR